jgi:23S rRNA pseudouridine1911/1915/1917 synthase
MKENNIDVTFQIESEYNKLRDRVLWEDNHLLVVNKAPSEIVQGDKTGDMPLVDKYRAYLKKKYAKPGNVFLGVTHRLDRPTSGAVIFARTSKVLPRINKMLQEHAISKVYWAVVSPAPKSDEAELLHYLIKNQKQNKSYAYNVPENNAKEARLRYKTLGHSEKYTLLEIELLTGRHHQIRAQLAAVGSFIKGDMKYGFHTSNPNGSIHLHARKLVFIHPVIHEPISIIAPVPSDPLWNYFEKQFG